MREQVEWFAGQMESKLQENDHKGGWDRCGKFWLLNRLVEEVHELESEMNYQHSGGERDNNAVIQEAADIANFAMMIADKVRDK